MHVMHTIYRQNVIHHWNMQGVFLTSCSNILGRNTELKNNQSFWGFLCWKSMPPKTFSELQWRNVRHCPNCLWTLCSSLLNGCNGSVGPQCLPSADPFCQIFLLEMRCDLCLENKSHVFAVTVVVWCYISLAHVLRKPFFARTARVRCIAVAA